MSQTDYRGELEDGEQSPPTSRTLVTLKCWPPDDVPLADAPAPDAPALLPGVPAPAPDVPAPDVPAPDDVPLDDALAIVPLTCTRLLT